MTRVCRGTTVLISQRVRSNLGPGDEVGFHIVEAESAEAVVRVTALAGIEVERIVEAIGVGSGRPSQGETEEIP